MDKHMIDLYNQALKDYDEAIQKLEKIRDRCNKTLELMYEESYANPYYGGRCIEAENILQIINEVNQ